MDMTLNSKTLGDIYNLPPEATLQGMDLLSQLQQGNQQSLQDNQQKIQQDQVMNPLRVQHQQGLIDTQQAQLPGLQAQASMLQRKDKNESLLNDDQIKSLMSKYKTDELKNHMTDLDNLGTLSMQLAETTWANPLGAAQRAKQQFVQSGHGDMWNPQWDNLPPDRLAMELSNMGKGLQGTSAKFNQALGLLQQKGQNAENVANIGADSREEVARIRAENAAALKRMVAGVPKDPKSFQEASTRLMMAAMNESDPVTKAMYISQAEAFRDNAVALGTARTAAQKEGTVNAGELTGLPSFPAPANPPLAAAGQPAQAPAAVKPPVAPPKAGDIYKGYKFKGGNPADKNNWEKQ